MRDPAGRRPGPPLSDKGARADEPALPPFLRARPDGLYVDLVDLAARPDGDALAGFVDGVFAGGRRFADGDYALLQKLLYAQTPAQLAAWAGRLRGLGRPAELRLAGDVVAFADERRLLYRGWRHSHAAAAGAEYFFEPIYVERLVDEPVFGEPGPDDEPVVLRTDRFALSEHQALDLDEFFAAAWLAGVRYGWDVARVQAEIGRDAAGGKGVAKVVVARALAPTPGSDASLREEAQTLHRDDAPKVLRNGRVDLTQFSNRFPQVAKNTRLLRKLAPTAGTSGRAIDGRELPPARPQDFDLAALAGPGTRVDRVGDDEFIVATIDGFLNIDAATNQFSVTEKIVNREGVSVRTTGNLSLQGDEFEEHGEVQERRVVEGYNMTFLADVYGRVVSRGGRITIRQHLAGGSARSDGGRIEVEGGASRADIEAIGGEVEIKYAENSRIVARRVRIERACLCDIVADEVEIVQAEGCAVAAAKVVVETTAARKDTETTIVVPLPDLAAERGRDAEAERELADAEAQVRDWTAQQQRLLAAPDLKTYLTVQKKKAAGEIALSAEQEAQFRALAAKVAPALRKAGELRAAIQALATRQQAGRDELAARQGERARRLGALACTIRLVGGDTVVRTRPEAVDETPLARLPARELRIRLRERNAGCRQLFAGASGSFSWRGGADALTAT